MIVLSNYLVFSSVLFVIGLTGVIINRKNIIILLMCIEIILLSVNTNFLAFSRYIGDYTGQIFVFFVLSVAAVEASIGLAILVIIFRNRGTLDVKKIDNLKG